MKVTGIFRLQVFRSGQLVEDVVERNMIVGGGFSALARLLGGGGTNYEVTKIGFGTGTDQPSESDTTLQNVLRKAVAGVSYPSSSAVQFSYTLEANEGNGLQISEFGLFTDDDTLFSRRVREAIVKDSNIQLTGTWTINFE